MVLHGHQKELDQYLKNLEEAEKENRKLGKEMDLFHFRKKTWISFLASERMEIISKLVSYMREKQNYAGYDEINTPEILDRSCGKNQVIGKNLVTTCIHQLLLMKKFLQLNL